MGVTGRQKVKGIGNPWGEQAMTRRSEISSTRGWLYLAARLLGDFQEAEKGPGAMEKRIARRLMGKVAGRTLWRLFR
jgi:hypothetical protein